MNHAPSFATESELDHQVKHEAPGERVSGGDLWVITPTSLVAWARPNKCGMPMITGQEEKWIPTVSLVSIFC